MLGQSSFCVPAVIHYTDIHSDKKVPGIEHSKIQNNTIILNEFLAKNSTNIIEQPSYSPDMAPPHFFLFLKVKLPLRGTCFQSIEDIKENSLRELKSIPGNAFKKCFDDWIIRWHKCIIPGGAYFEGDKINLDEYK